MKWLATTKWKDEKYFTKHLPTLLSHSPTLASVRLHLTQNEEEVFTKIPNTNWSRVAWLPSITVPTHLFFHTNQEQGYSDDDFLIYSMTPAHHFAKELNRDYFIDFLTVGWSPPLEVNVWIGTAGMTTPTHYDLVHNLYVQVTGRKRFILFSPQNFFDLSVFPVNHPASRQSQIDLDGWDDESYSNLNQGTDWQKFKQGVESGTIKVWEAILEPGQVLYIPPCWFHHVVAIQNHNEREEKKYGRASMSVSVHTAASEGDWRGKSLNEVEKVKIEILRGLEGGADKVNLKQITKLLRLYIREFYGGEDKSWKERVNNIIDSHWNRLWEVEERRKKVRGLTRVKETSLKKWKELMGNEGQETTTMDNEFISDTMINRIIEHARIMRQKIHKSDSKEEVKQIIKSNHVEHLCGAMIGALYIHPFLHAISQ